MKSQVRISKITQLLVRFVDHVRAYNAQSLTDINREAQNFLVPIFRIVFDLPHLHNLDNVQPNHPAIDLADKVSQFAFQVTSDPSTAKIRETLEAFTKFDLGQQYSRLAIYILTKKQSRYDSDFSSNLPPAFDFDKTRDIIDYHDLINLIRGISSEKQEKVLSILEDEFGDKTQSQNAWVQMRFVSHDRVYVQPTQYKKAEDILTKQGIVVLSGPPHIGKTETAYELLLKLSAVKGNGGVRYFKPVSDWNNLLSATGKNLLLDDPFGATSFDDSTVADRFDDLIRLAKSSSIVITTRSGVLQEAHKKSQLGESGRLKELTVELQQEGSYNDSALSAILDKHVQYALETHEEHESGLSAEQAKNIASYSRIIIYSLRFPHNIAHFVNHHAPISSDRFGIFQAIEKAKDITRAVKLWYDQQTTSIKAIASIASLFPAIRRPEAESLLTTICGNLHISIPNVAHLIQQSSGYLRLGATLEFIHPSYAEGVLLALKSNDIDFAWDIIRQRSATNGNILSLLECRKALKLINIDDWTYHSSISPHLIDTTGFLSEYIRAYNQILRDNFNSIRSSFDPEWEGEARVIGVVNSDDKLVSFTLLQRQGEEPLVTTMLHSKSVSLIQPDSHLRRMALKLGQARVVAYSAPDITRTIPQVYALDNIIKQVEHRVKDADGIFLNASWHIRLARLFRQLKSAGYPVDSITDDNPLTAEQLEKWALPYFDVPNNLLLLQNSQNRPLMTWRISTNTLSINDLNIPLAIEDINIIEASGRKITGPLLIQPDLSWDEAIKIRNPRSRYHLYTNEQLRKATLVRMQMFYQAYKQTAEMSFPSLCSKMSLYCHLPLEITCVLDLINVLEPWDIPRELTKVAPLKGANPGELVRISMHMISDDVSIEEREYVSALLEDDQYWNIGGIGSSDEDEWVKTVLGKIEHDIKDVFRDPNQDLRYYPPYAP